MYRSLLQGEDVEYTEAPFDVLYSCVRVTTPDSIGKGKCCVMWRVYSVDSTEGQGYLCQHSCSIASAMQLLRLILHIVAARVCARIL